MVYCEKNHTYKGYNHFSFKIKDIFPIPPTAALPTFGYSLQDPIEKHYKVQLAFLLRKLSFVVKKYETTAFLITKYLGWTAKFS